MRLIDAVPVRHGNMRLIDLDYALEDMCRDGDYASDYTDRWLEELPRVDAVPVRHGKWIDRNGAIVAPFWERYECSECGARSDNSNYCPNCGARMDAERKEE